MSKSDSVLVIFDFDGVLVNSKKGYALQMQETIHQLSGKEFHIDEFAKRVGNTDQLADFKLFLETEDEDVLKQALEVYNSLTPKYTNLRELFPNVIRTLEELREYSHIGVVSRKSQSRLQFWLDYYHMTHLIDIPIGTLEYSKALAINKIRNELSVAPEHTIMVGDTVFDIKSAKEARVKSAVAAYDSLMLEEILALEPDFVLHKIEDIISAAKSVN
ncbi:MAG: HAD family hydrolase [Candidatus Heimdallarchaeaceae archaeon]